jgi:preprotein translocase subunit SecG
LETYLDIAMIITSIALIASVILQSKGAGLGGLSGMDTGGIFFSLALITVIVAG